MIQCEPFPSHPTARGNIGTKLMAEILLNHCDDAWIEQHVPEMTRIPEEYQRVYKRKWELRGYPVAKVRPIIKRVWQHIPDAAKHKFLLGQFVMACKYLYECYEAFYFAELPLTRLQREEFSAVNRALHQFVVDYPIVAAAGEPAPSMRDDIHEFLQELEKEWDEEEEEEEESEET